MERFFKLPVNLTLCIDKEFYSIPIIVQDDVLRPLSMAADKYEDGSNSSFIQLTRSFLSDYLIESACDCSEPCYRQRWADKFIKWVEDHLDQYVLILFGDPQVCDRQYYTTLWNFMDAGYSIQDAKYIVQELTINA